MMGALHLPPKKPSEAQAFAAHLELALETRFELFEAHHEDATLADVLKAVLDSVTDARKEMGWA
jgi:hypothetical protein